MESTLFPIGIEKHIIFCIVAAVFFVMQFLRTKQWYQLVMAAAIPLSLLIYIDEENTVLFYGIGILEAVLLAGALVLSIWQSQKQRKAEKAAEEAKKAADDTEAPEKAEEAAAEEAAEPVEETAEEAAAQVEETAEEAAEQVEETAEEAAAQEE